MVGGGGAGAGERGPVPRAGAPGGGAGAAPQPAAAARAPRPFLGDDIFVLIAAELDARMLGRLGCVAQRFWRASVPDPAHKGSALPELWSVAVEGARRRLA